MRKFATLVAAAIASLTLASTAVAAPPKPCDDKCQQQEIIKLKAEVKALQEGPVLTSAIPNGPQEGSQFVQTEAEGENYVSFACPNGSVLVSSPFFVRHPGESFGVEFFGEQAGGFFTNGGDSAGVSQPICIYGHYVPQFNGY